MVKADRRRDDTRPLPLYVPSHQPERRRPRHVRRVRHRRHLRRNVRRRRLDPAALRRRPPATARPRRRRPRPAPPHGGHVVSQPGHHLYRLQRRRRGDRPQQHRAHAAVRPRAAHHPARGVGDDRERLGPAHPGAEPVHPRRLRQTGDLQGRPRPAAPGAGGQAVSARDARRRGAGQCLRPHLRHRPDPRRRGVQGSRGQLPQPQRRELRAGEPRRDEARLPQPVRQVPRAGDRGLPVQPARHPPRQRAGGGGRPDGGGAHAGHLQLGLFRALVPRAADGRGAGRGARPRRQQQLRLYAHHRRPEAGGRNLPAH